MSSAAENWLSVRSHFRPFLRAVASGLFAVYIAWNVFWLLQWKVPSSLFLALTGIPCPTTGGTRSLRLLLAGNWHESLRYNAMTVPICLLLVFCFVWLCGRWLGKRRLVLPNWTLSAWGIVLSAAWLLKLLGDTRYW